MSIAGSAAASGAFATAISYIDQELQSLANSSDPTAEATKAALQRVREKLASDQESADSGWW